MRKQKANKLKEYINELKTIKYEINNNVKNKFLSSECYLYYLNNGRVIPRELLKKRGKDGSAVMIAPYDKKNDEFLVVIEPRVFTSLGVAMSFPAGYIEKDEHPLNAAKRELLEETGYTSSNFIHLDSFYQDEGVSKAYNHIYLAKEIEKVSNQKLDESEIIKYMFLKYSELLELEKDGLISGGNTKLTLSKIKNYI